MVRSFANFLTVGGVEGDGGGGGLESASGLWTTREVNISQHTEVCRCLQWCYTASLFEHDMLMTVYMLASGHSCRSVVWGECRAAHLGLLSPEMRVTSLNKLQTVFHSLSVAHTYVVLYS